MQSNGQEIKNKSCSRHQRYYFNLALEGADKTVISYPKFLTLIVQNSFSVANLVQQYLKIAKLVKDSHLLSIVKNDPSDNIILSCALSANADFVVSGDKHLLTIEKFQNIPIISPKKFLDLF